MDARNRIGQRHACMKIDCAQVQSARSKHCKERACARIVAAALALAVDAGAAPDRKEFRWRAPIFDEVQTGTLYRAIIPFHVLDGSKAYPADVRLLDAAGHECPFFIRTDLTPDVLLGLPAIEQVAPTNELPTEGAQTIYLDVGFNSVSLRRAVLQTAETNFARTVKVYGRKSETDQWRWIAEGALHRLPDRERDWIELNENAYRYLKLEILRFEEPPISITHIAVLAEPHYLFFQAHCEGNVWLYFGSREPRLPLHELRHRLSSRELATARHAAIGPREENPYMMHAELYRYAKLLLLSILIISAALAAGIILKRMRR